jgi:hypothetical protein
VSLATLDRIALVVLIAHREHFGGPPPWHTQGGIVTEPVPPRASSAAAPVSESSPARNAGVTALP